LPKIERYYAPAPYDERKIFFDLGQGSQHVTSIDTEMRVAASRIVEGQWLLSLRQKRHCPEAS